MGWILSSGRSPSKAGIALLAIGWASLESCEATPTATVEPCEIAFCVALPVAANDTAFAALGVWPFGVHGSSHAVDGHPGWDIEFKIGSLALAAEVGTVQSIYVDSTAGVTTVQLSHTWRGKAYRTVYTNLAALAAGVSVGAAVARGQPLGVPQAQTHTIGTRTVVYAAIHFQLDDFSSTAGLTNVNAVSPETHLLPEARALFASMWAKAAYTQQLCEPYATNSRTSVFPLTRSWRQLPTTLTTQFVVTCVDPVRNDMQVSLASLFNQAGSGTLAITPTPGGASEIDIVVGGVVQRGLYRVVGDTLKLQLNQPGGPRPASLSSPALYVTARP